jgi:hypothetical protein
MTAEAQPPPYLSVVVTSRNDGHGGDPLGRLQTFVNTFAAQCRRFGLDAELVVVDWNPPAERPRLHQAVTVPPDCPFAVRFIEVPPALHNSLPHPTVMPLFQMIGKNVGARRARGQFVLCSNIDIIFSNELVQFFASRTLQESVLYRVDRHDIESDYPADAPLDVQLAYCRSHHLRVHRAWGTFPTDSAGRLVPAATDIFLKPSVTIGDGWHVREGDEAGGFYRWATNVASVVVTREERDVSGAALELDLEPNPYDPASWVDLEVRASNVVLARTRIDDRRQLRVPLADTSGTQEIVLRTLGASDSDRALPAFERRPRLAYRVRGARLAQMPAGFRASAPYDASRWRTVHREASIEAKPDHLHVRSAPALHTYAARYGPLYAPRSDRYTFVVECTSLEGNVSMHLVDEAADRFVAGGEFEIAERDRRLLVVSADLERGQPFAIYLANKHRGGDGISRISIHALHGSVPMSELQGGISGPALVGRARRLVFRVWRGATRRVAALFQPPAPGPTLAGRETPPDAARRGAAVDVSAAGATTRIEAYLQTHRLPPVHRNAAGDFQLMARRHWFELQGYAEFTMYSMNVDGFLGDVAYHSGIREETLTMPCCIYHLEHTQGSGWTPEGEGLLRQRLAASGADWLDAATVDLWSAYMDWLKRPMLFNPAGWGFGGEVLAEVTVAPASSHVDA